MKLLKKPFYTSYDVMMISGKSATTVKKHTKGIYPWYDGRRTHLTKEILDKVLISLGYIDKKEDDISKKIDSLQKTCDDLVSIIRDIASQLKRKP